MQDKKLIPEVAPFVGGDIRAFYYHPQLNQLEEPELEEEMLLEMLLWRRGNKIYY